jgi:V/A-type H+-transporting ATPase subunit C
MNAKACYLAINTKFHTRKKALLSPKRWEQLLSMETVPQVITFLRKQYGYSDLIGAESIDKMHRGDLEVLLGHYTVLEIERMLYYFSGSYKEFFKILLMEYEIRDLKMILRRIARQDSMEDIEKHFVHSTKYPNVRYDKLLNAKTVEQFVNALKGTKYYDVLKTLTLEDAIQREFHMEMKLNMLYYQLLMEKAKKLEDKDKKIVEQIIGLKIDLANIQWIYRGTKYFNISREEILIYSLTGGNKITYSKLKKLAYAKSIEEFKELVTRYMGDKIFSIEDDALLERSLDILLYESLNERNNPYTIAFPLTYICKLEIELKDMIAITEGIRYGLPKSEIKKYLVHKIE